MSLLPIRSVERFLHGASNLAATTGLNLVQWTIAWATFHLTTATSAV
jgi:hypothetical protein